VSLHRGNHYKPVRHLATAGDTLPAANFKGVVAAAKEIRGKFRSPFGFCGPRRAKA
jgi:hypothetical protein